MTEIAPHLGGYIPGGDPATYYPDLWRWLVEDYGLMTIADVGCGEGKALDYFWSLGAAAVGFEGTPQAHPQIVLHDYTVGPVDEYARPPYAPWDLVWSCEFVEHVEERYIPNFLHTFALGQLVLMTHAEPGQDGPSPCQLPDRGLLEGSARCDRVLVRRAADRRSLESWRPSTTTPTTTTGDQGSPSGGTNEDLQLANQSIGVVKGTRLASRGRDGS